MSAEPRSKLKPVSKSRPCPVCQGGHKCSTSADGTLILCGRRDAEVPGFKHLGPCQNGTWHKYVVPDPEFAARAPAPARVPAVPLADQADACARALTPELRDRLAAELGLPAAALRLLPDLGWEAVRGGWTVPERDAGGRVCGVGLRLPGGAKRMLPGSSRGVVFPAGWADAPGPLFVVEGMSDAVALAYCGLAVVGRPNNVLGADLVAAALSTFGPARPVVVLGENDRKPDGAWPGRDGADRVAAELAALLPGRTVLKAMPPEGYKDCRAWVLDRSAGFSEPGTEDPSRPGLPLEVPGSGFRAPGWAELGREVGEAVGRLAEQVRAGTVAPRPVRRRYVPLKELDSGGVSRAPWVWDGYLARGSVTLLSALPKCGKTTLLSHLFRALPAGGEFCGRALVPGRAAVASEESALVWEARRDALGLDGDAIRVLSRPFLGRPTLPEWVAFVRETMAELDADPADLVVFDTLADLWPVKDENSATEVTAALQPLKHLANGRAVLLVHHLRKSDGAEGTGSRGSGALAGSVDVIIELRRPRAGQGGPDGRRVLTAVGRSDGIPREWAIELDPEANAYRHADAEVKPPAEAREGREEARRCGLREAILSILVPGGLPQTRKEIWDRLPPELRVHEVRFKSVLEAEAGKLWVKDGGRGRGGHVYRRQANFVPATDGSLFHGGQGLPD